MADKKDTVPLIYAYIYMKIKKQMVNGKITGSTLRKLLQKIILCDKSGGNIKGIPGRHCYDIIKDLVDFELIENVGRLHKDIIYEGKDNKVSEVVERLKDWKINAKLRDNKKVKDKLGPALELLDGDKVYRVLKSQCDRKIKQAFW